MPSKPLPSPDLDYSAQVPMDEAAPITVKYTEFVKEFEDYIPPPGVLESQKEEGVRHKQRVAAMNNFSTIDEPHLPVVKGQGGHLIEMDFMGAEEYRDHKAQTDKAIRDLAKQLYDAEQEYREEYRKAKELVAETSKEELENPTTKELRFALKLLSKAPPITKREAVERAKASARTREE